MLILIGNQKGGAGKSTVSIALANELTIERHCPVTVVDMDYQQSVIQKFDKAKLLENDAPYDVVPATIESFGALKGVFSRNKSQIVLIDLPGKLDDEGLLEVYFSGDLLICPFGYDEFSFVSTVHFALVIKRLKPDMPMVFVPNRIKANAKFEIMDEVNTQLARLGHITPILPDRIDFQRISTFQTPPVLKAVLQPVLDDIYNNFIHGKFEIAGRPDQG